MSEPPVGPLTGHSACHLLGGQSGKLYVTHLVDFRIPACGLSSRFAELGGEHASEARGQGQREVTDAAIEFE